MHTEECDADDPACSEEKSSIEADEIASSSTLMSSIMASSSYYYRGGAALSSSAYMAAATDDILTDFHEAKLVKPKPNPNTPRIPDTPVTNQQKPVDQSFQDNINQDRDLGSSGDGMPAGTVRDEDTKPLSALSNVEAGVLSACGVLVVAGIAVGIFVWKNTTRRRNIQRSYELPMVDIEQSNDDDPDNTRMHSEFMTQESIYSKKPSFESAKHWRKSIHVNLPSLSFDRDDFFSSWQRRNSRNINFDFEPKQKSPIKIITAPVISEKQQDASLEAVKEEAETITTTGFRLPSFEHTLFTSESEPILSLNNVVPKENKTPATATAAAADDEKHNIFLLSASHLRNSVYGPMFGGASSPQLRGNTTSTIPSAMDPAIDPTALTYPLQKFLREVAPNSYSSPMQISVNLNSEQDDQDDEEEGARQHLSSSKSDTQQQEHFSHQLNKFLKPTTSEASSKVVDINLREDVQKRKSLDQDTEATTLDHLEKVLYQELKQAENNGKSFMSPLDLPNHEYVPLRNSKIEPGLVSRAEVLADPKRRLGQDEIALWENKCKKKQRELSLEQILREGEPDMKHIVREEEEEICR